MSERLDRFLVEHGLAKSRERAKSLIKEGKVFVNGAAADKPSVIVSDEDKVSADVDMKYVGRGALKLIKALDCFEICLQGCFCADLGASTGGFTQVMLERGASKVYAVDVGHGQLDESLVSDSRVVNLEGVNVKDISDRQIPEKLPFVCADLSFISLRNVIGAVAALLKNDGKAVVLIKPQFEAGRNALNKQGIVKDRKDHIRVICELIDAFHSVGLSITGLTFSPVRGGSGNIEYLALLERTEKEAAVDVRKAVDQAFDELRK